MPLLVFRYVTAIATHRFVGFFENDSRIEDNHPAFEFFFRLIFRLIFHFSFNFKGGFGKVSSVLLENRCRKGREAFPRHWANGSMAGSSCHPVRNASNAVRSKSVWLARFRNVRMIQESSFSEYFQHYIQYPVCEKPKNEDGTKFQNESFHGIQ